MDMIWKICVMDYKKKQIQNSCWHQRGSESDFVERTKSGVLDE